MARLKKVFKDGYEKGKFHRAFDFSNLCIIKEISDEKMKV